MPVPSRPSSRMGAPDLAGQWCEVSDVGGVTWAMNGRHADGTRHRACRRFARGAAAIDARRSVCRPLATPVGKRQHRPKRAGAWRESAASGSTLWPGRRNSASHCFSRAGLPDGDPGAGEELAPRRREPAGVANPLEGGHDGPEVFTPWASGCSRRGHGGHPTNRSESGAACGWRRRSAYDDGQRTRAERGRRRATSAHEAGDSGPAEDAALWGMGRATRWLGARVHPEAQRRRPEEL